MGVPGWTCDSMVFTINVNTLLMTFASTCNRYSLNQGQQTITRSHLEVDTRLVDTGRSGTRSGIRSGEIYGAIYGRIYGPICDTIHHYGIHNSGGAPKAAPHWCGGGRRPPSIVVDGVTYGTIYPIIYGTINLTRSNTGCGAGSGTRSGTGCPCPPVAVHLYLSPTLQCDEIMQSITEIQKLHRCIKVFMFQT